MPAAANSTIGRRRTWASEPTAGPAPETSTRME